jgi:hypothetical protein
VPVCDQLAFATSRTVGNRTQLRQRPGHADLGKFGLNSLVRTWGCAQGNAGCATARTAGRLDCWLGCSPVLVGQSWETAQLADAAPTSASRGFPACDFNPRDMKGNVRRVRCVRSRRRAIQGRTPREARSSRERPDHGLRTERPAQLDKLSTSAIIRPVPEKLICGGRCDRKVDGHPGDPPP